MLGSYSWGLKFVKRLEPELTGVIPACLNRAMAKKGHARPTETEVQAIARRLLAARAAMGIDQAELCRRSGIKPNTYNQWEQAVGAPSRLEARKLKKALGWTLDYIYENDPTGMPHGIAMKLDPTA
jgi:ribosome-binding protein aMBF1 (putative translation factor)